MLNPTDVFETYSAFFAELKSLYSAMDQGYEAVAAKYGFQCSGCEDNCCFTRFFHHTCIEYLYLIKGFFQLDEVKQDEIRRTAAEVNEKVRCAEEKGETPRVMCPLNFDDQCVLYEYRPMICRLHGIPHEFNHPVQKNIRGPGCGDFDDQCGDMTYISFNRTLYYRKMADLERRLREKTGQTDKFKHTIAQMIMLDEGFSK